MDKRSKEVHGKEETAEQQKRKLKAAISVQALHDLQYIWHDQTTQSILFHQDHEEASNHLKQQLSLKASL